MVWTKIPEISKKGGKDYLPIFTQGVSTFVHKDASVRALRRLEGFCAYNGLPSGRISKLQGGYYILTDDNRWEFFESYLYNITFGRLYEVLSSLTNPYTGKKYGIKYYCNSTVLVLDRKLKKRNFKKGYDTNTI